MNKRKVRNRLSVFVLLLQILTFFKVIPLEIAFIFLCALVVMGLAWGHEDIEIKVITSITSAIKKSKDSDKDV